MLLSKRLLQKFTFNHSACPLHPPTLDQHCDIGLAGPQDCHYAGDHCCCGRCFSSFVFSCVLDSESGNSTWQTTICPAKGCGSSGELSRCTFLQLTLFHTVRGVLTSRNFPDNYPNDVARTHIIKVQDGTSVSFEFTAFDIEWHETCKNDHLTIRDGDGTTLMEKRCGSSLPANTIISRSNIVELYFKTDYDGKRPGWSVSWSAVILGE